MRCYLLARQEDLILDRASCLNVQDAMIADNAGNKRTEERINQIPLMRIFPPYH